ncbi:class I SAM-dependent methyltransferase [Cohnella thailandensis]|uniref:Class I SAM-dependent methyltransferase n=1 Tax=Cohnella thailandensis TaxID=557557 RepID=A0A841SPN8_9BACL|nr:class I SAM-dependent methyltransferase [Cohnella thailandensis]MBB6632566.1 class I SAM-dependent methyltransferase [Cohnella thailandensis]MBP1971860.1 SAM-dependent methyltransferase [Cohnella thailandensis]
MSRVKHEYVRYWENEGTLVIDCKTCGFIHVDPIPTRSDLNSYYSSKYYSEVKPFKYEDVDEAFVVQKLEEVSSNGSYKGIFQRVNRLLPAEKSTPLKMLDIGCGNDLLSKYYINHHWNTSVIEPNSDAAEYLRKFGITVHQQFAEELGSLRLDNLSFVNIQFVLEHIADPTELLRQVYEAMAPGGVLRICVPNDFSVGQLAYQEYYEEKFHWIVRPDHINYFSFTTLSGLLRKCGFEEKYRTTNFPLEFFLLGGHNYYSNEVDKKMVNPFVRQFQHAFIKTGRWDKLAKLYESLAAIEMGRSIFMFAVKR